MLSERATRAQLALDAYVGSAAVDSIAQAQDEWLEDILADILHLASERGVDAYETVALAVEHYGSEQSLGVSEVSLSFGR